MISRYSIEGFKCFKTLTSFNFSRVNLFTGYNGRGKSSLFQSLLLLSQSVDKNADIEHLCVNGKYVSLGTYRDLLSNNNAAIAVNVFTDSGQHVTLKYKKCDEWSGKISELVFNNHDYFETNKEMTQKGLDNGGRVLNRTYPRAITDIFRNFYFISANRLGPTLYEEKSAIEKNNPLGILGEHRLNVLASDSKLLSKVSQDISYIMDGGNMELMGVKSHEEERETSSEAAPDDAVLSLCFGFNNTKKKIRAINVGFGYSYVLPIVTLINSAKNCSLFIENPEAHLHPLAQSRLMRLLCAIPKENNVQVFVETHSEHIINAVRLYTLKPENDRTLSPQDVNIYFFDKDYSIKSLKMDDNAQIDNWPRGFFDQQEQDLSEILRLGLLRE